MHALALPLLEDVVPHLLADGCHQPNGKSEGAGRKNRFAGQESRIASQESRSAESVRRLPVRGAAQEDGLPAADGRLAELMTALASSLRACASAGVSAEASSLPSLPLVNISTLLCKLLGTLSMKSGCKVRNKGRILMSPVLSKPARHQWPADGNGVMWLA